MTAPSEGEGLWDWSVRAYARPSAADAALALQDEHGQNVPFLLFAVWSGGADPARLAQAAGLARAWEATAVGPLRAVRRALKAPFPRLSDQAREAVRSRVKAVELEAERTLLHALDPLGRPRGRAGAAQALVAAVAAWGGRAPPAEALEKLASALA